MNTGSIFTFFHTYVYPFRWLLLAGTKRLSISQMCVQIYLKFVCKNMPNNLNWIWMYSIQWIIDDIIKPFIKWLRVCYIDFEYCHNNKSSVSWIRIKHLCTDLYVRSVWFEWKHELKCGQIEIINETMQLLGLARKNHSHLNWIWKCLALRILTTAKLLSTQLIVIQKQIHYLLDGLHL